MARSWTAARAVEAGWRRALGLRPAWPLPLGRRLAVAGLRRGPLVALVFVSGMSSMAVEMAGSRLLAPYFGTSQYVWAVLVGLILLSLTLGYFVGGRLADRWPSPRVMFGLAAWAGLSVGLIPIASRPILRLSAIGFARVDAGIFLGSLAGVVALFLIPVMLLSCISPFAIRLSAPSVQRMGGSSGGLYGLSTLGSILGTFLSAFVLVPAIGTVRTFYVFALALIAAAAPGLWKHRSPAWLLVLPVAGLALLPESVLRPAPFGKPLYTTESAYYYIQVVQRSTPSGPENDLVLDEGHAVHSIYNPNQLLNGGPWEYFMITPFFNSGERAADVHSAAIVGLAGGTVARDLTAAFGPIPIDGAEIDPKIIDVGRQYFGMTEPNLNAVAEDGRYFLAHSSRRYDIVALDAYRQPYIPFHLTTREFFEQVRDHLTPTGVAVANAGRTRTDYRLVGAIASTMKSVFPNVYVIDLPDPEINSLVVGTNQPTTVADFSKNLQQVSDPTIRQVAAAALQPGRTWEVTRPGTVYTDDWAPVEKVINQIILGYARSGGD